MSTTPSRRLHVFATAGISLLLAACGTASGAERAWTYEPVSGEWGFHTVTASTPAGTTAPASTAANGRATPTASPAAVAGGTQTAEAPAAARVSIVDDAFESARVTVRSGGRVSWTNNGNDEHSIKFVDAPESPVLATGARYSRSFSAPGTYAYVCGIHSNMTGTVVVAAATSTGPDASAAPTPTGGTPGAPTAQPAADPTADPTPGPTASPDAADRDDDDRGDDEDGDDHGRHHGHGGGDDEDRDEEHGGDSGPG